ncbi:hypothetical protein ACIQRE_02335 [Streptomyces griseoluteus]
MGARLVGDLLIHQRRPRVVPLGAEDQGHDGFSKTATRDGD